MAVHHPPKTVRDEEDRGYAFALTALALVPLLLIAGLAVDVGSWHTAGTKLQRTADAAALAGVTFLPRGENVAVQQARDVAARNGYIHSPADGVTVDVVKLGDEQLKVTITDANVKRYLTSLVGADDLTISRTSTAEYLLPVPLGSPRNFLGTNRLMSNSGFAAGLNENYWLGMNGYCSSKEQGERIAAFSDANFQGGGFQSCVPGTNGVIANEEFRASGYYYAVQVPPGFTGNLDIQAYDLPYCSGNPPTTSAQRDVRPDDRIGSFDVTWRVRGNNSLNPSEATVLSSGTLDGGSSSGVCSTTQNGARECTSTGWGLCWKTLQTLTSPSPGIYFIQLTPNVAVTANQQGTNHFALRAKRGSTFTPCSADPTASGADSYSATCPNVFGIEHLGVYAGLAGTQASFFLADVGQEHSGKTMEVTLWDSGEGADAIQILNPNGVAVPFDWTILCQDVSSPPCSGENEPTGGRSGTATAGAGLDVSGSGTQPGPNRTSDSKYNDRHIRIEIPLPSNINTAYSGRTWWKIQYTTGGAPTDRTTWSVIVRGDPVRLVPNE